MIVTIMLKLEQNVPYKQDSYETFDTFVELENSDISIYRQIQTKYPWLKDGFDIYNSIAYNLDDRLDNTRYLFVTVRL